MSQPVSLNQRRPHAGPHTARAVCWACGAVQEKTLRGARRPATRLNWHCARCEVSWSGPAERPYG